MEGEKKSIFGFGAGGAKPAGASLFGGGSKPVSLFGSTNPETTGDKPADSTAAPKTSIFGGGAGSGLFGAKPTTETPGNPSAGGAPNLFGKPAEGSGTSNLFGAPKAAEAPKPADSTTPKPLFGGMGGGSGLFGAKPTSTEEPKKVDASSEAPKPTEAPKPNLFGAGTGAKPSGFGFGAKPEVPNPLEKKDAPSTAAPTTSLFGAPKKDGPTPNPSPFGAAPTGEKKEGASLFGAPTAATGEKKEGGATGLFGSSTATAEKKEGAGLFEAPKKEGASSLFGAAPTEEKKEGARSTLSIINPDKKEGAGIFGGGDKPSISPLAPFGQKPGPLAPQEESKIAQQSLDIHQNKLKAELDNKTVDQIISDWNNKLESQLKAYQDEVSGLRENELILYE
jgi:hypothetical protein